MSSTSGFPPGDWRAENLKALRAIWEELRPEEAAGDAVRRFRGRELTSEQAGDVFERWVLEAFRLSGLRGHYGYPVPRQADGGPAREQVDGLLFDGWQAFVVEAKFWTGKVDFAPIARLQVLAEQRVAGTLGLFFSAFGYTAAAVETADLLRPIRVLLFDQVDLAWSLAQRTFRGSMLEMVRRKWRLAVKLSRPSVAVNVPMTLF
jgi:hypothetical protein